ncbi:MAG TPA: nucleotidyltransferase domain-containing protein [Chthoniobacterales bacterium]
MKTVSDALLDEAVEYLVNEVRPEAIYLFGSHAWGAPTDDSDLDFFVIVPESNEPALRRAQRAHGVLSELKASKDVLVFTRAEVDRVKHLRASLSHQILQRGRKLYG